MAGAAVRQCKIKAQGEVLGVPARAASHLLDCAPITQGMIQGGSQGVGNEAQGVEKIAFAGAVGTDQKGERLQVKLASCNTLVIADRYPTNECCVHLALPFMVCHGS